ncbi:flavodoxin [Candidatus Heimdallarchaeota archaeon B3_Heim]|nr:MAG: flavodoxin [Candidatus Heimdallarchaeota archaeon B3_Heim]
MGVLILNGDHKGHNKLTAIQEILEDELKEAGWDTETFILNEYNIKGCTGCFKCWDTTPGICTGIKGDDANKIVEKVIQNELLVFLTPLTFGGYSSELKAIIERMLGLLQPGQLIVDGESHHLKRYERYPSVLAFAVTDNLDKEEEVLFKKLLERHSRNFYPPMHKTEVFQTKENEETIRDRVNKCIQKINVGNKSG